MTSSSSYCKTQEHSRLEEGSVSDFKCMHFVIHVDN